MTPCSFGGGMSGRHRVVGGLGNRARERAAAAAAATDDLAVRRRIRLFWSCCSSASGVRSKLGFGESVLADEVLGEPADAGAALRVDADQPCTGFVCTLAAGS